MFAHGVVVIHKSRGRRKTKCESTNRRSPPSSTAACTARQHRAESIRCPCLGASHRSTVQYHRQGRNKQPTRARNPHPTPRRAHDRAASTSGGEAVVHGRNQLAASRGSGEGVHERTVGSVGDRAHEPRRGRRQCDQRQQQDRPRAAAAPRARSTLHGLASPVPNGLDHTVRRGRRAEPPGRIATAQRPPPVAQSRRARSNGAEPPRQGGCGVDGGDGGGDRGEGWDWDDQRRS